MPLSAVASRHLVRTTRHSEGGPSVDLRVETLLTLTGPSDELRGTSEVSYSGHVVALDWSAGLAWHRDGHADPALTFGHEGRTRLQLFLNDLDPRAATGDVAVRSQGGAVASLATRLAGVDAAFPTTSSLARERAGRWVLTAESAAPFEAVYQRTVDGRAVEEVVRLGPGVHALPVGPAFCESLGVALSPTDVVGGGEDKHMVLGKFGAGCARHLLADGVAYAPKVRHPSAYRALVAKADASGRPGGTEGPCWPSFDEVEAWAEPDLAEATARAMAGCPVPWRVRTYARADAPGSGTADVLVVEPGREPVGRAFSYMLFDTAADWHGFAGRLERAAAAAGRLHDGARLVDRSWFSARESFVDPSLASFGVAFSTPAGGDLSRGAVAERRRRTMPDSACRECEQATRCDGALPYPYGREAVGGAGCAIRAALDGALVAGSRES